jgi:GntR family transcriptional regulator, transcriptional repressor for pyruvate dehydrogenase complex
MKSDTRFDPHHGKRAFEHIAEQIRNRVFSGMIHAGERLPSERELAEQFQTGRLAVREAFRVLEEIGLIYIKKGRTGGAYIRDFSKTEVSRLLTDKMGNKVFAMKDVMEARADLECIIIARAIERMDLERIAELQNNVSKTAQLISKQMPSAEAEIEFHMLLARAAGNHTCETFLSSTLNTMRLFLLKSTSKSLEEQEDHEKHLGEHKAILQAIENKNCTLAQRLIRKHIQHVLKHFSATDA